MEVKIIDIQLPAKACTENLSLCTLWPWESVTKGRKVACYLQFINLE